MGALHCLKGPINRASSLNSTSVSALKKYMKYLVLHLVLNGDKLQMTFREIPTEDHGGPPTEDPFLFVLLDSGGFNL